MMPDVPATVACWLLTVALHASVLMALAWLIDRARSPSFAWRELMWRCAIFAGVFTASVQLPATPPLVVSWHAPPGAVAGTITPRHNDVATGRTLGNRAPAQAAGNADLVSRTNVVRDRVTARAQPVAARKVTHFPTMWRYWSTWIIAAWLTGAAFAAMKLLLRLWQLREMLRGTRNLHDRRLADQASALARVLGAGEPRVSVLDTSSSPLALTRRRIVIPAWALTSLEPAQTKALLAHELTHIRRGDPQWKLLLAAWHALFWFLPLMTHARRRLDALAELACDTSAAQHAGDARRVAECLTACVEQQLRFQPVHPLATAMASRESSVLQRVERLLQGGPMQNLRPGLFARAAATAVIAAGCFGLPAIAIVDAPLAHAHNDLHVDANVNDSGTSSHVSIDDGWGRHSMSVSVSNDHHAFSAKVEGKIAINAPESDIASLSAGGTASFVETRDGVTRRLDIAAHAGQLQRTYFVNGHERAYDAQAREWFAKLLPAVLRESGIHAEARVKRLFAAGGAAPVLDETAMIHSDYVRGKYLHLLFDMGRLKPADLDRALKLAGDLDSDYERGKALSNLFTTQELSTLQQLAFLKYAGRFDSDYERAQLLIGVEPKLADSDAVRQAWLDSASRLSSSYERRRTLESMLKSGRLNDTQLAGLLSHSANIGSDYEHRVLLTEIAAHMHDPDALAVQYTHSAGSIGSDYERRQALLALIHAGKLGARSSRAVLDSAAHIGSDYDCREVLLALAQVMPTDAATVARYRQVARRLSSSERDAAEAALVR